MTMLASERSERRAKVERVSSHLRAQHLVVADLLAYGGDDLPSPERSESFERTWERWAHLLDPRPKVINLKRAKTARAVERTWELIADLGLTYADLEAHESDLEGREQAAA